MSALTAGVAAAAVTLGTVALVGRAPAASAAHRARRRAHAPPAAPTRPLGAGPGRGTVARLAGAARSAAGRVAGADPGDRALPELLAHVARELRAGASLHAAVAHAASTVDATTDPSTAELAHALQRGVPLAAALDAWGAAASPARQLAATALALAADTGGATALVVDGVADTLRDRVALDREVAALSSQARASAALLVVAPLVVAVLAAGAEPRIAAFLLGSPGGWACIVGGVALDAVGALWMRAVVARAR